MSISLNEQLSDKGVTYELGRYLHGRADIFLDQTITAPGSIVPNLWMTTL